MRATDHPRFLCGNRPRDPRGNRPSALPPRQQTTRPSARPPRQQTTRPPTRPPSRPPGGRRQTTPAYDTPTRPTTPPTAGFSSSLCFMPPRSRRFTVTTSAWACPGHQGWLRAPRFPVWRRIPRGRLAFERGKGVVVEVNESSVHALRLGLLAAPTLSQLQNNMHSYAPRSPGAPSPLPP